MMRSLVRSAVIILAFATTSFGQISYNFSGNGARAAGMGGAYIAVSDDITALSWNPAGLWVHESPILGVSYGSYMPRGEFSDPWRSAGQDGSWNSVSGINFLAPVRLRGHPFVMSASFGRSFEDYQAVKTRFTGRYSLVFPETQARFAQSYEQEFHQAPDVLSFGFGTRLYDNVSMGVATNIYLGQGVVSSYSVLEQYDYPALFFNGTNQTATAGTNVTQLDTTKYSGLNFTVGFKYTGDKMNAGLLVRTPFSLTTETDQKIFTVISYAGLPTSEGSDTTYFDNVRYEYDMPLMIGAGFSYQATEDLLLAIDAEYRGFKDQMIRVRDSIAIIPGADDEEFFTEFPSFWKNVFTVRVGGEYALETGNDLIPLIPLRLGYAYEPSPSPNATEDGSLEQAIGHALSLGFGVTWSQVHLDIAYTRRVIDLEGNLAIQSPGGLVTYPVQVDNRANNLTVSFTGYF